MRFNTKLPFSMEQAPNQPTVNGRMDHLSPPTTPIHTKEFVAAFIACIGPIAMGSVIGYTSPALPQMKEKFQFDDTANSLIGSLMTVGALTGALISGLAADFFGRKSLLMYTCVPFVVGWLLIAAAQNVLMLFAGRFVAGFCVGITSMCAPTYVTEIASPEVRGVLGSCFQLFVNFGVLFVFVVGSYVPWNYLAMLAEIFPVLLLFFMIPLPESPCWLVRQTRHQDAVDAVLWLRGTKEEAIAECHEIRTEQLKEAKMSWREFINPLLYRPFLVMFGQMFVQQMCGINAVIFNAVDIFRSANDTMNPQVAGMIIGVCMFVATIIAFFLIDRAGRRILLLISAIMMAAGMLMLDAYYCIREKNPSAAESVWWLPVLCLVLFVFFFMVGFGPVPWLMMGEVFPSQARGLACSMITAINWTLAFIVTQTFKDLQNAMGPYGSYWLFGGFCVAGTFFVYFCVPETKGKTLEEVQEYFAQSGKGNPVRSKKISTVMLLSTALPE